MENNKPKICVLGLGYIGLPTASMFATHGHQVHGVDINPSIIKTLKEGHIHIEEPGLSTVVKAAISSRNLNVDTSPNEADVFIIAVPTPYLHNGDAIPRADMTYVEKALESILPLLKSGNIVILESTSPPGTINELVIPSIRNKTKFEPGRDIGVAYCPERVIPGRALQELIANDRVVGAINQEWGAKIKSLYKSFVAGQIFLTEPTVAEMVKILENTYRDVNIALANEAARLCEKLGISAWETIEIANRHPRVHLHKPGPGVGGHCISVDPWFLVEKFPQVARLINTARNINDHTPQHVAVLVENILKSISQPKIAVLGLAFKGNVDDERESPSAEVIKTIQKRLPTCQMGIYDPHVKRSQIKTVTSAKEAFDKAHLVLLLTAHDEFKTLKPEELGSLMAEKMVFDCHNILPKQKWLDAGYRVFTLGDGKALPLIEGQSS